VSRRNLLLSSFAFGVSGVTVFLLRLSLSRIGVCFLSPVSLGRSWVFGGVCLPSVSSEECFLPSFSFPCLGVYGILSSYLGRFFLRFLVPLSVFGVLPCLLLVLLSS
jgi:hypothetical protein